jgi:hypothetical protein
MQNNKETMQKLYQYLAFDIIAIANNEKCKIFVEAEAYKVRMKHFFHNIFSMVNYWVPNILHRLIFRTERKDAQSQETG